MSRECDLIIVGEQRSDRDYGFACRKDTTICRDLDVAILRVTSRHHDIMMSSVMRSKNRKYDVVIKYVMSYLVALAFVFSPAWRSN